ncbi:MAG: S9 family peptidase [Bacteroidetes bacterium HGW-Bacteroidetes-11]|jgi:dipeptidyl-peptidase-4|nr:MAG: S9 family peptidase [Bacteroidetes bacterium HGW-Bacteroidetes-11]
MKKTALFLLLVISLSSMAMVTFAQSESKPFTLDDLLRKRVFASASVYGIRSMNDGLHYTTLSSDYRKIEKFSYKTGKKVADILDLEQFEDDKVKMVVDYEFSADESKVLIQSDYEPLYRRSFKANYFIYDIKSKAFTPLSDKGMQQLATFSPDGSKIAFVRDNNIFITDIATGKEQPITTDGKFNEIINGAPDWVYEEEFSFNKAFEWSPDGKKLAYMKFDERNVKMFGMTMFQGQKPALDENALYPANSQFKYPKAGEDNSVVTVHIYNLESGNTIRVNVGPEKDQYIPRIRFTSDPLILAVLRLNRLQNELEILKVNANTGKSDVMFKETNKYFIDEGNYDNITFLPDGKHFVMTSERDGWSHLYLFGMDGNLVRQLTSGEYDITEFYGFDPSEKKFYYQAAGLSPMGREIYTVTMDGKSKMLTSGNGTHSAEFSSTYKYYIHKWSSASSPVIYTLYDAAGKKIRVLEDNQKLVETLAEYKPRLKEFFTFTTAEGVTLNGFVIYPPEFDPAKKYPVLMNQYSGPNSQQVTDNWSFGFDEYIASQGYIVMCVDPRGTGGRGEAFRKVTYLQLGKYETIDQIEAAKYAATLPYIDAGRIGIWGWSYGGFISSSCMVKGEGVFSVGIAVAPVTNWRYYDNIYTERFMRKPQDNPEGYDQNSPLFFADKLQGKLFLIHGAADDNVHVQNTMEFSERLVQAGKQFDQMIYTNRNHGIYGGNTRMHLFAMIEEYLRRNL